MVYVFFAFCVFFNLKLVWFQILDYVVLFFILRSKRVSSRFDLWLDFVCFSQSLFVLFIWVVLEFNVRDLLFWGCFVSFTRFAYGNDNSCPWCEFHRIMFNFDLRN